MPAVLPSQSINLEELFKVIFYRKLYLNMNVATRSGTYNQCGMTMQTCNATDGHRVLASTILVLTGLFKMIKRK